MFNLKVYTMKRQRFFEGLGLKVYVTLAICMALLLNVQFLNAQSSTINVKGVVNDAMGPVIGASVVEKGNATNGTITDIDGNFSLKVPSDATLTISFIGYKTVELPVAGKTSFTVTLKEDSEMLDEVVVVGFGTQKKVNLTGSVKLGIKFTAIVSQQVLSSNKMSLLFKADKLMSLAQTIGGALGNSNSTISAATSLLNQYEGLQLGFELEKQ